MFSLKFDSEYLPDRKSQLSKHAIALYKHSNLEEVLQIECRTDLEKRLKLDVCSLHRCTRYIVQILCSDDKILIDRALQQRWLYKSESFVRVFEEEIYPSASKRTFLKVVAKLRKYVKSSDIAREYYTFLKEHEEYDLILKLLPLCSSDFIFKEISSNTDLKLTEKSLNEISVKCPMAAKEYLVRIIQTLKQKTDVFIKYFISLRNLAKTAPDLYVTLHLEIVSFKSCCFRNHKKKFGYSTTRILLNRCGRIVIENIVDFIYTINAKALYIYLRTNGIFDSVYDEILKKIHRYLDFSHDPISLLTNEMKRDKRLPKIIESYNRITKKQILKSSKFASSDWPMFLEPDIRNDWAASKIQGKRISWCKFMTTEESMKVLKRLICNDTSLSILLNIFETMIVNYIINGENDDVLVYILNELKDNFCVFHKIAQKVVKYLYESVKLHMKSVQVWAVLKEILDLLNLHASANNNGFRHVILEECIRFSIASNTPLDEGVMDEFVAIQSCRAFSPRLNRKYGSYDFEKSVLEFVLRHIEETIRHRDTNDDLRESIMAALFLIDNFNCFVRICNHGNNKKVSLADFPWLVDCIVNRVDREEIQNGLYTQLKYILRRDGKARKQYVKILLNLEISESFLLDVLAYQPDILNSVLLGENFLQEFSDVKMNYVRFYKTMKLYYGDVLCDKWKSSLKFHVNGFDTFRLCIRKKLNAALGLSCLMDREEFEEWSTRYLYEVNPEFFSTRSSLIKNLHHISPIFTINRLLEVLCGDMGVLALPALWSISNNLPARGSIALFKKFKCNNAVVTRNIILVMEIFLKKNQW